MLGLSGRVGWAPENNEIKIDTSQHRLTRAEGSEISRNEGVRRKARFTVLHDLCSFLGSQDLQHSFNGVGGGLVLESVENGSSGEVWWTVSAESVEENRY